MPAGKEESHDPGAPPAAAPKSAPPKSLAGWFANHPFPASHDGPNLINTGFWAVTALAGLWFVFFRKR
jgi:hypothetical protein